MCETNPEIRELFTEHGLRCTKQRIDLYETLAGTKTHPTAEELHRLANEQCCPGTSLATVYNTLEALCEAGLCRAISVAGSGTRYDAVVDDHLHVVAEDGVIVDVPDELSARVLAALTPEIREELSASLGVEIAHVDIHLHAH
ncbi:MAG: transcriptional repressor [Planctomycetota bacterium]